MGISSAEHTLHAASMSLHLNVFKLFRFSRATGLLTHLVSYALHHFVCICVQ